MEFLSKVKLFSYRGFIVFALFVSFNCNKKAFQKNEYSELIQKHPVTDVRNYSPIKKFWNERAQNIGLSQIEYTVQMNQIDGFSEVPTISQSTDQMIARLENIKKSFRPEINAMFDQFLYAIYFCEKLGGTGLTGFVYNNDLNKPVGGFIIIDSSMISKKANDWISYKENSVFRTGDIKLQIQIEKEEDNTIDNALRYILLHEMGHIISNTMGITPDMRKASLEFDSYPFFNGVWIGEEVSVYDSKIFPFRPKVKYYSSPSSRLKLDLVWDQVYPMLDKTRFTSLYGATNALDDFAESFVSYIHCILDNRPWELTLTKKDKVIFKMKNRIHELEREKEFLRKNVFKEIVPK